MRRPSTASYLRISLLLLLGLLVLDYVWVKTHPESERRRWTRPWGSVLGPKGCPDTPKHSSYGQADYDWTMQKLDGTEFSLGEFREKVVFVNVWATWCGPCRNEMPNIQALYDTLGKEGVAFVLVSEEEADEVRSFVEGGKYSFPVYTTEKVPPVFDTRGIPATFVVNRHGTVVLKRIGSADWNANSCHTFLRALL